MISVGEGRGDTSPVWRKSSYSHERGECVEVARVGPGRAFRDSRDPGGPALPCTADEWRTLLRRLTG
ncbi:DUF397 domain-containing protein [Actinomadura kijaniata]|uniref:DUF397 domain-containing protein n=1 Tax=Actinomadura kijaniata TaxID=46161 RepID=UPI000833FE86|nr:DUF397 domain-containing protein [Actinomadura kijaniata]